MDCHLALPKLGEALSPSFATKAAHSIRGCTIVRLEQFRPRHESVEDARYPFNIDTASERNKLAPWLKPLHHEGRPDRASPEAGAP